jgi:transposase
MPDFPRMAVIAAACAVTGRCKVCGRRPQPNRAGFGMVIDGTWVKQAEVDAGTCSDGLTSAERAELGRLRRENRQLKDDVEVLKRATAFLATGTR